MPRPLRDSPIAPRGAAPLPPWQTPPPGWTGDLPEWAVYWALQQLGLRPNEQFIYQDAFGGGRLQMGGAILDFFLPGFGLAIRVQGVYWHYSSADKRASDLVQKLQLESAGIRVVDIDDDQLQQNPLGVVQQALLGIDQSRVSRGAA